MDPADEPGDRSVVVVHGEYDPVPEDVDERSPGGLFGDSGGLDVVIAVSQAAQVVGQGGPPGGGVPDVPFGGGVGADAAGFQVSGRPAPGEPGAVEGLGVPEDGAG